MSYLSGDVATFTWSNKDFGTDQAPTTDYVVEVRDIDDLIIQVDTTALAHTSSSVDINALMTTDYDAATPTWDTASTELIAGVGDGVIKTYKITALGGGWVKLRLDNNTNPSKAYVTVKLRKRSRRD